MVMSGKQLKGGMQFSYVFICMDITLSKNDVVVRMHNKCSHYHNTGQTGLKKFWLKECIWQPSLYLPTISRSWKKTFICTLHHVIWQSHFLTLWIAKTFDWII